MLNSDTRITFLGHATVAVRAGDGSTLVIDPYEPGGFHGKMDYAPIGDHIDRADLVISTHAHADHAFFAAVPDARVIHSGTSGRFHIERVPLDHDEYGGRRRGGSVDALIIDVDEYRIVHLSDVGQAPPRDRLSLLREPDVLLVPIGGYFTIGAFQAHEWIRTLNPRAVVPIHYKTAACTLPIRDEDLFLRKSVEYCRRESSSIDVENAADVGGIIVLAPAAIRTG